MVLLLSWIVAAIAAVWDLSIDLLATPGDGPGVAAPVVGRILQLSLAATRRRH
jgi:hypothetical protein